MANTTSHTGQNGWNGSSLSPSLGSLRSEISMVGPFYPSTRSCHPGMRVLLRSSLSLKLSEHLESLGWNPYVCNTYSNPLLLGSALGLSPEDDTQVDELISLVKLLMPSLLPNRRSVKEMRRSICRMQATECLLISSPICFALLLLSGDKCSHVVAREQLSLTA